MSKFVKNKTSSAETDVQGSSHGPNCSQEQEIAQTGQCRFIKSDGSQCKAYAVRESFYCFIHDPHLKQEREAARVKGGKERSRKAAVLPADTPDRSLTTSADLGEMLADTINKVSRGELDPRVANAMNGLANSLFRVQQQDLVERRLEKLESILTQKWAHSNFGPLAIPESPAFEFVKAKTGGEA
jgi:hypothetical protein